ADYGPSWREHRRFALMTLKNFGLGKRSMEERILEEISHVCTHLEVNAGKSIDPQTLFHNASCDIICSILFGSRYEYEHEFFQTMIKMMSENSKIANGPWGMVYDTMPLLRNLPLPYQKALRDYNTVNMYVSGIVNEHRATRVPGEPRDVIDCYLDEMEKDKAQVSFEDRHKMPYTQAVIHECQRMASTLPLSVFHCTTRDTKLMGYQIPKGTLIIPDLSSLLHNVKCNIESAKRNQR
ncbi:cytochrome P450 CYP2X20, partial [Triplophysa rosa]